MAYNFKKADSTYLQVNSASISGHPYTFSAWVYPKAVTNGIVISVSNTNGAEATFFGLNAGLRPFTNIISNGINSFYTSPTSSAVAVNTWSHIAFVVTGNPGRLLYSNGVVSSNTSLYNNFGTVSTTRIGSNFDRNSDPPGAPGTSFEGDIADLAVWNQALPESEIGILLQGYSARMVRPQSLVFYAPLIREPIDAKGGFVMTNSGAVVSDHPRIYY
jgi:hypothetical protein